MMIRMVLILSLIMQLAFSMPCCGLVVFRLDFELESCEKPALVECELQTACCAATSCCDIESPTDTDPSNEEDSDQPVCVWCIPLDHKKVDHASQLELPPPPFIAYEFPAVNRAVLTNRLLIAHIPPPRWTTSQQRQSLLAVWTI